MSDLPEVPRLLEPEPGLSRWGLCLQVCSVYPEQLQGHLPTDDPEGTLRTMQCPADQALDSCDPHQGPDSKAGIFFLLGSRKQGVPAHGWVLLLLPTVLLHSPQPKQLPDGPGRRGESQRQVPRAPGFPLLLGNAGE